MRIGHAWRSGFATLCFAQVLSAGAAFAQEAEAAFGQENSAAAAKSDSTNQTPVIVITPNRFPTSADAVGSSLLVVGQPEIERQRENSLVEVLRNIPEVVVTQSGAAGKTASVSLRGATSNQTLILIDGIRVNDNTAGGFDIADLTPENIERIEVLRGPQSVLYGSEAIGGVINIITRQGTDTPSLTARFEGGNDDLHREALQVGGSLGPIKNSSSVSFLRTEGFSSASERAGNSEQDPYRNFTASTRFDAEFLQGGTASASVRYVEGKSALDGFDFNGGAVDDLNFVAERESIFSQVAAALPIGEFLIPSVQFGFTDDSFNGKDPDTEFNNYRIDSRTSLATVKADLLPTEEHVLSIGYTHEQREARNQGVFDEEVDLNSIFLLEQWSWREKLFLTGGIRNDNHGVFSDKTTYRFTASVLPGTEGTRLHTSYGTGFRAPSFNELFFPNFGNPALDPEESWGVDVGIEQAFLDGEMRLDVAFFYNRFRDLIGFTTEPFLADNINRARAGGIESRLEFPVGELARGLVAYTYTDSEDEETGDLLPRRPKHRGVVQLNADPLPELTLNLTLYIVQDSVESDGSSADDYERMDVTAQYTLTPHVKPYVRIENLWDEDYEEVRGFTSPGITAAAGVLFTM